MIHFVYVHETFVVNDLNQFSRPSLTAQYDNTGLPSNDWKLEGAVEYRFGRVHKEYTVDDIRNKRVPWHYKNGKQRCFALQYDHGSHSVMMSPRLLDVMIT